MPGIISTGRLDLRLPLSLPLALAIFGAGIAAPIPQAFAGEHYKPEGEIVVNQKANITQAGQFVSVRPSAFGVSRPIRETIAAMGPQNEAAERRGEKDVEERVENERVKYPLPGLGAGAGDGKFTDPLVARSAIHSPQPYAMPTPLLTFLGLTAADACQCLPPDTNGDVGPNHYVQSTNVKVAIYDKTGTRLLAPSFQSAVFFTGLPAGNTCRNSDDGDPVVLYDPLADRWMISQFEVNDVPGHQCIAISTTPDPTGSYYAYDFVMPSSDFQDYPHYGVWTDGYYLTTNQFNQAGTAFLGAGLFAFDRVKMLAGDPTASYVYKNIFTVDPNAGGILPTDIDGFTPPPAGLPNRAMEFRADEFGAGESDGIRTYELVPNYATPASSTFTVRTDIPLAPFDARAPTGTGSRNVVEQQGVASTSYLDAISDRVMFRMGYRNLGTQAAPVNSWVGNFTVNVSGVAPTNAATFQTGIRWFELRSSDASTLGTVRDQGTQNTAPGNGATGINNWMGSIAQDNQGNIALGFSQSGTTSLANIVIAGRTGAATGGVLNEGEATFFAAGGAQSSTSGRWGDYSSMSVDPVDECTFWYSTEYYQASSSGSWSTRIGKFILPGCTAPAKGLIAANVTNCANGQPLPGATVTVGGHTRTTTATGALQSNVGLAPGDYVATASKATYTTVTSGTLTVTNGGTVTFNTCLAGTPVMNAASPATVTAESFSPANNAPDPNEVVTVNLALKNVGGADATNVVATLQPTGGVTLPSSAQNYGTVTFGGAAVTRPYTFTAAGACGDIITLTLQLQDGATNLGNVTYTMRLGTLTTATTFTENFDAVTAPALPAGWTTAVTGVGVAWASSATTPSSAPNAAFAPDVTNIGNSELVTPVINVPAGGGTLSFKNLFNMEASSATPTLGWDGMVLEISINGGAFADITTGGNAFLTGGYTRGIDTQYQSPIAGRQAWSGLSGGTTAAPTYIDSSIALPAAAAGQPIRLKWRAAADNGFAASGAAGVRVDNIVLVGNTPVCSGAPNNVPTISSPSNQSINEDGNTGAVNITVGDTETPVGSLVLTASSGNTALVPNNAANLTIGGSGAARTITVTPAANQFGTATITLTVTDAGTATATSTFDVVVAPINDAPTFTLQGNRNHFTGTTGLQTVAGYVTGVNLGPSEGSQTVVGYTVTEFSDTSNILSGAAIAPNGTLTYTLSGASGSATIRVTMQDSGGTTGGGVDTSAPVDFVIAVVGDDVFKDGYE